MSRLDELIAELCPDGVPFQQIEDVFVTKVAPRKLSREEYRSSGSYPVIDQGQNLIIGYTEDESAVLPEGEYVIFGEHTRHVKYVNFQFAQGADGLKILTPSGEDLTAKYLYYAFSSLSVPSRGYNRHWLVAKRLRVPIPPLPVQHEIVRILDKFTELEAELEVELEAELEARKGQIEHYRKSLLESSNAAQLYKLEDLFSMRAGKSINASDIVLEKSKEHAFPCYGGNGLRGYVKEHSHNGKFALIGRQGALCGNVKRVSGAFYATEHAVVVEAKAGIDIDWAYHMLTTMNLNQYATKSAQPGLSVKRIGALTSPVPPLEEQKHIAATLDRFDALVNDITQGLPAEITARRKQYEYYRDKLLTFKEKVQ